MPKRRPGIQLNIIVGKNEIVLEIGDDQYALTAAVAEKMRDMLLAGITKLKGASA